MILQQVVSFVFLFPRVFRCFFFSLAFSLLKPPLTSKRFEPLATFSAFKQVSLWSFKFISLGSSYFHRFSIHCWSIFICRNVEVGSRGRCRADSKSSLYRTNLLSILQRCNSEFSNLFILFIEAKNVIRLPIHSDEEKQL